MSAACIRLYSPVSATVAAGFESRNRKHNNNKSGNSYEGVGQEVGKNIETGVESTFE